MAEQANLFTDDTRAHSYLIIIHPGFHVTEKVKHLKNLLNSHIPLQHADLHSKAHISLAEHKAGYNGDILITELVKKAVSGIKPFDIELKETGFWDSGTFYLKVHNPKPVQELSRAIQRELSAAKKRKSPFENGSAGIPHITLGRYLSKQAVSMLPLDEFLCNEAFRCTTITILKKVSGSDKGYEALEKIKLKG